MKKTSLSAQATKKEFINSIHNWLMNTLKANGKSEYKDNFYIQTTFNSFINTIY